MDPTVKSSLLWGMIGALAYLVLLQGYQLVAETFVGLPAMVGVATVVGCVSAVTAHALRPRIRARANRADT